jgi:hypothetical protein
LPLVLICFDFVPGNSEILFGFNLARLEAYIGRIRIIL